jgi:hypothetical protein
VPAWLSGLPVSSLSSRASSSALRLIAAARSVSSTARFATGVAYQPGWAAAAACTARSISAGPPRATAPSEPPVAGSMLS